MSAQQPVPFAIVRDPGGPATASNGTARLAVLEDNGTVFLRRGIKRFMARPANETLLPLINEFAGQLLNTPEMTLDEARARMEAIAATLPQQQAANVEWVVAELNGVRVYYDGRDVIVTTRDLQP